MRSEYGKRRLADIRQVHRDVRDVVSMHCETPSADIGDWWMQSVYVIGSGELFKVGISSNVRDRLSVLRTANPFVGEILYVTDKLMNAPRIEGRAHQKLSLHRVTQRRAAGHEWFRCDPKIAVDIVKELAEKYGQRMK